MNQAVESDLAKSGIAKRLKNELVHELHAMRDSWWCLLILGITLIICGIGAASYPLFSSMGVIIAIGALLLISGISSIVTSFWMGEWSGFLIQLLVGIFYTVLGLAMAEAPLQSTAALTLLVAAFSVASGSFRIVAAIALRFPQWGWGLVGGIVTLVFGVIVFRHFPEASLWLIGMMVGIDMLFNGINWIMISLELRSLPAIDEQSTEE